MLSFDSETMLLHHFSRKEKENEQSNGYVCIVELADEDVEMIAGLTGCVGLSGNPDTMPF